MRRTTPEQPAKAHFVRCRSEDVMLVRQIADSKLGFNVELPLAFDAAVMRVRAALKQEGFGVLTEIDLRAAFREKLGREFHPYVILGACNPPLAFSAISADPSVGLLLPCNVTVEWLAEGRTGVRLTDPEALLSTVVLQGAPELTSVAHDARQRMWRVADSLRSPEVLERSLST
jgi:uncharacterized protein (DUF302 family)